MILAYGNYRHALAEAGVSIARETRFSSNGIPTTVRERWRVQGALQAESAAGITRAIEELCAAYTHSGQDAVLYLPDGATRSAHALISNDAIGGVRVTRPPQFPQGRGAEYSTFRSYTIELEAEFPLVAGANLVTVWEETLTLSGGGPRWVYLATLTGPPVRQQIQEATPYRVAQTGRAIGFRDYPAPAEPIWPAAWHQDATQISRRTPHSSGRDAPLFETEYEVTWHYQFESTTPLVAQPTRR